ncbi:MAG: hypothetical protein F6K10_11605 [Moorea sp. SIO2B7]|nr:hypothetical protein [Moorena sp. SIO2B7]
MEAKIIICWFLSIYSAGLTLVIISEPEVNPIACLFSIIMFLVTFPRFYFEAELKIPQFFKSLLCLLRFLTFLFAYMILMGLVNSSLG